MLIRCYRNIWLDRFQVAPGEDWNASIGAARERATGAIVIVSDEYLQSAYCRAEFEYFQSRGTGIIAVIARDFSTELIADFTFSDWIDCRRWFDDTDDLSIENLLSQVPESEAGPGDGERREYLRGLIQELELGLAMMPTSWLSMRNCAAAGGCEIRPRQYQPSLINDLEFTAFKSGAALPAEDLARWSTDEPQFVLCGEHGSGKTAFARLLALSQAHAAMRDEAAAVPVWFDLAKWDEHQPDLSAYIESQWTLVSFWGHWLQQNRASFTMDNWDELCLRQPAGARSLSDWINANPNHRFVVLSAPAASGRLSLPRAQIDRLNASRAQRMSAAYLNLEQQNSFRQLLRQKAPLIENNSLDYLALGLELLSADRALAFNQWQQDPVPSMIANRLHLKPSAANALRATQITAAMRGLAWAMLQNDSHRYILRKDAEQGVNDPRVIECALAIGILREVGNQLRFESAAIQRYLALESLTQDGLVKYLTRPEFGAGRGRLARKWDALALTLVDAAEEDRRPRLVEQIADIDPFLGLDCARRHPALFAELRQSLIGKMVQLCARNPSAQKAFRAVISALPQSQQTALALVGQLSALNNAAQLWLWHEIAALPLELPLEFLQLVTSVDRDASILASELLGDQSLALSVACLVKLSGRQDEPLRRNAIWLLGELRYLPTAILLLDYLEDSDRSDTDEVLVALMKFAYSEILARVFRWSLDNPAHRPALVSALSERKRLVTSRLLSLADAKQLALNEDFYQLVVDADETEIAIGLAGVASQVMDLPDSIAGAIQRWTDADEWGRRIAAAVKSWPKQEAFAQLMDDIARVLQEPPESTVVAGSNLEALVYGAPLFDSVAAQAEERLPDDLLLQLSSDDWRQRHQGLNHMLDYPAAMVLPQLLKLTEDEDKRVKLAAFAMLARFEGDIRAEKALLAALSDQDGEVVRTVADLLKSISLADADPLLKLLENEKADAVSAAIEIIASMKLNTATAALQRLLSDSRVSSSGAMSIGQQARKALADITAATAVSGNAEHPVTVGAGRARSAYSDEEKIARTLAVLRDDDWGRTQKAAKFLRKFARHLRGTDNRRVASLLTRALNDANWSVRWAAAEALAVLQDRAAIPRLTQRLDDSSWIVQVAVIRGLAAMGAVDSVPMLLPALENSEQAVREAAAAACGVLKASQAIAALGETVKSDSDDFVRFAALRSLQEINPTAARPWLELALSDGYLHLRLFAMQQLAPLMDDSHLPLLKQLLDDDEKPSWETMSMREMATETLMRIDSAGSRALLESVSVYDKRASV